MTGRLAEVVSRIGSARQLDAVMAAMRGIAAAREREARERLVPIRAYAAVIGGAIGQALALTGEAAPADLAPPPVGRPTLVVLAAEQGFAGAFDDRVLDAVEKDENGPTPRLLLVGDRGLVRARERGLEIDWSSSMISHVDQAGALADRIAEEIYARLAGAETSEVSILHAAADPSEGITIIRKTLAPFDYQRFPTARRRQPPLIQMPPRELLARLTQEYVFAELCEAAILSFAAENEARRRAMTSAQENVERKLETLVGESRRLRQEEITNEIIELFASHVGEAKHASVRPDVRDG